MKRMGGILAFVLAVLCTSQAEANGPFRGNGLFYGGIGSGVSSSADLSLDVGTKLVLDADEDSSSYLYATSGTATSMYVDNALITQWTNTGFFLYKGFTALAATTHRDDVRQYFGTGLDGWLKWDTTTTPNQLSLTNTDCDGGGTDCVIWYTEVGSPDLFVVEDVILNQTKRIVFDGDEDSDTFIDEGATNLMRFQVGGANVFYINTVGPQLRDNISLQFGTGFDQTITYADTVGVTWNDGTNDVIRIPDDTGTFNVLGGRKIGTRIIDVDDSPYTALATDEVIIADTDSGTGAPAAITVNLPASSCGIAIGGTEKASCRMLRIKNIGGTSNVTVDANASEEIDAATTQTVTPGGNLVIVDAGQTNYHWVIQ